MVESSSHNSSSPEITPKEELVTLDKPKSSNPFLPADQVEFTFKEITLTTNNEVALLYPSHPKSDYCEVVSYFISMCCLKEAFTRAPTQYKEYLCEFWYTAKTLDDSKIWVSTPIGRINRHIGITTFRNTLRAHYLPHSSMYLSIPSIKIIRPWFATIGYSGEINAKGTLKKSFLPPSGLRRKRSSKHISESKTEASKSKTGQSDKETKSTGGPASLGDTSEERARPQLSSDSTTEVDLRKSAPMTQYLTNRDKLEQQKENAEVEVASLKARPPYPNINQLTKLLVAKLKNIQWELSTEFLDFPSQVSSVQEKLKTLDSLPSLLNKVTNTLNRFATVLENASGATAKSVPSEGLATASHAEGRSTPI
nr:hypothetical protein [Tanacetum cinerariifolium]